MFIDLQYADGKIVNLQVDDKLVTSTAIVKADEDYFVFQGYRGGFAHIALFIQCNNPLTVTIKPAIQQEPKQTPEPRRFLGQKLKEI